MAFVPLFLSIVRPMSCRRQLMQGFMTRMLCDALYIGQQSLKLSESVKYMIMLVMVLFFKHWNRLFISIVMT